MYSHLLWDKTNQGLVDKMMGQWTSMNLPPPNGTRHVKHMTGTLGGKNLDTQLNLPAQQDHPDLKGLWGHCDLALHYVKDKSDNQCILLGRPSP
jgi:hypothetical protein